MWDRNLKNSLVIFSFIFLMPFVLTAQLRQVYLDQVSTNNHIQKISFYSPSSGYIASTDNASDFVGFTTDSGHTIIKRYITLANVNFNGYPVNLTFGFSISGVKAFNQDTILAYGDYGFVPSILYSTNGGLSYILLFHSSPGNGQFTYVNDMVFPQNNNIGYAVDGYRILKTADRGINWTPVSYDPSAPYDALDAIDNNNLFVYSAYKYGSFTGKLLKTTNGGTSWLPIAIPDPHIHSADFISPLKGWLNLYQNVDSMVVYYTANGGTSWTKQNSGTVTPALFDKMQFVNDSTGYAISGLYTTFKTTDSAKVWEPLPRDNNYSYLGFGHNDMQVITENQLWSGGARDLLELSTNGGGTRIPRAFFKIDTTGVFNTGNVNLVNYSRKVYSYQWFVNNNLIGTSYNINYTHVLSSQRDTIQLVVSNGTSTDTLVQYQQFVVPNLPVIGSFTPQTGSTGTFVTISGTSLTSVTSVKFGGTAAASFTILNDTTITAIVANGSTGNVSVADIHGSYSKPGFTYFPPPVSAPPVISSFTPLQGPAGTSVTITGTNFASTVNNNIVMFGATRANISSASSTQIICQAPAASTYGPITVQNLLNGLSGTSNKPFILTFADSSNFTSNSFINEFTMDFGFGIYPKYITGRDLDMDGKPELILTKSSNGDSLLVYKNNSLPNSISFGQGQSLGAVGTLSAARFSTDDIDGDGLPDIVAATNFFNVFVYRNNSSPGTIQFQPKLIVQSGVGSQDISITDLDNDGRPDLAVACFNQSTLSIIRNTSSPGYISFAAKTDIATPSPAVICSAGDLDGDGKKDIVTQNYLNASSSSLSIFRNLSVPGTIQFATRFDIAIANSALNGKAVHIADMDLDGKPDLVVVTDNNYQIFLNTSTTGSISFAAPVITNVTGFVYGGFIGHLSGDRKPDLMYGRNSFRYFTIVKNNSSPGTLNLDPPVDIEANYPNNIFSYYGNSIDFTQDGKPDILVSGTNDSKISIYKNSIGSPVLFGTNICSGTSRSRTSDAPGAVYSWQENSGAGFVAITDNGNLSGTQTATLTITNIPLSWHGRLYRCLVDGVNYSSQFLLQVNTSATPVVSISTPTTTVCSGSLVTFTATATNTSPLTSYTWQVNGVNTGQDSPVFTTNGLTNGSQVRVILFNPCSNPNSTISNFITMTVQGGNPSVSISSSANPVCPGSNTTFTATAVNGGATPFYQWKVNGVNTGSNSNTFTSSNLNNNDQVQVVMTATATSCGTYPPVNSNTITVSVLTPVTPSVSIVANPNPFCQGGSTIITATPVNGGAGASYQWQRNGVNFGPNTAVLSTGFLSNGDLIKVIMTSNATCASPVTATSNTITINITSNVIPDISISGNTTVISGQATIISSTTVNPGAGPLYQWQDSTNTHSWQNISGAVSSTISYTPTLTGNKLRCQLSSNANCAAPLTALSNSLQFTVTPVTAINPDPAAAYGIRYYPNPAGAEITIDSLRITDRWETAEIINMSGVRYGTITIANKTRVTLTIKRLVPGQYIIALRRKNAVAYLKFIKQ